MVTPAMITLLGVGHVFDIGAAIRAEVFARRPKVVALELDPVRYQAIMSRGPRRKSGARSCSSTKIRGWSSDACGGRCPFESASDFLHPHWEPFSHGRR